MAKTPVTVAKAAHALAPRAAQQQAIQGDRGNKAFPTVDAFLHLLPLV